MEGSSRLSSKFKNLTIYNSETMWKMINAITTNSDKAELQVDGFIPVWVQKDTK